MHRDLKEGKMGVIQKTWKSILGTQHVTPNANA